MELLGLKIVRAKKDLYFDNVPAEVQSTIKSVAVKFHELSSEIKLRNKLIDFSCLMLVLRGQNIEGKIDKVYDREKMKFRPTEVMGMEDLSYKSTPHVVFVTNPASK